MQQAIRFMVIQVAGEVEFECIEEAEGTGPCAVLPAYAG